MTIQKALLFATSVICFLLAWFGSQKLQVNWLGNVAGGLHALNFAINLAK